MDYMDYPDMNLDAMVDDYLEQYFAMNGDRNEFPSDEELEMMYQELCDMIMYRYPQYGNMQMVSTQQLNNLIWLALIAAMYRRYPFYRRRPYGRRPYYGRRYGYGRYRR